MSSSQVTTCSIKGICEKEHIDSLLTLLRGLTSHEEPYKNRVKFYTLKDSKQKLCVKHFTLDDVWVLIHEKRRAETGTIVDTLVTVESVVDSQIELLLMSLSAEKTSEYYTEGLRFTLRHQYSADILVFRSSTTEVIDEGKAYFVEIIGVNAPGKTNQIIVQGVTELYSKLEK